MMKTCLPFLLLMTAELCPVAYASRPAQLLGIDLAEYQKVDEDHNTKNDNVSTTKEATLTSKDLINNLDSINISSSTTATSPHSVASTSVPSGTIPVDDLIQTRHSSQVSERERRHQHKHRASSMQRSVACHVASDGYYGGTYGIAPITLRLMVLVESTATAQLRQAMEQLEQTIMQQAVRDTFPQVCGEFEAAVQGVEQDDVPLRRVQDKNTNRNLARQKNSDGYQMGGDYLALDPEEHRNSVANKRISRSGPKQEQPTELVSAPQGVITGFQFFVSDNAEDRFLLRESCDPKLSPINYCGHFEGRIVVYGKHLYADDSTVALNQLRATLFQTIESMRDQVTELGVKRLVPLLEETEFIATTTAGNSKSKLFRASQGLIVGSGEHLYNSFNTATTVGLVMCALAVIGITLVIFLLANMLLMEHVQKAHGNEKEDLEEQTTVSIPSDKQSSVACSWYSKVLNQLQGQGGSNNCESTKMLPTARVLHYHDDVYMRAVVDGEASCYSSSSLKCSKPLSTDCAVVAASVL